MARFQSLSEAVAENLHDGDTIAFEGLTRVIPDAAAHGPLRTLNEGFASLGIPVLRQLGIPEDGAHVNLSGGAIALGHPLGMSGGRTTGSAALVRGRGISIAREAA